MVKEARPLIVCKNTEIYRSGEKVSSLVNRPPSIQVGTAGSILNRMKGSLYAVKMPNGDLYRWLAVRDLYPVDPSQHTLRVGDLATVQLSMENLFYHPELKSGAVVKIIKIVETDYYVLEIDDKVYGWFAGFEISTLF